MPTTAVSASLSYVGGSLVEAFSFPFCIRFDMALARAARGLGTLGTGAVGIGAAMEIVVAMGAGAATGRGAATGTDAARGRGAATGTGRARLAAGFGPFFALR